MFAYLTKNIKILSQTTSMTMNYYNFNECIQNKINYDPDTGLVTKVPISSFTENKTRTLVRNNIPSPLKIDYESNNTCKTRTLVRNNIPSPLKIDYESNNTCKTRTLVRNNIPCPLKINTKYKNASDRSSENITNALQSIVIDEVITTSVLAWNNNFYANIIDNSSMTNFPMMHRGAMITTQSSVGYQNI
jgi:hypothetical protein